MDRILRSGQSVQPDPAAGAKSRANLLRNSAQWIDSGQADLIVLTPIHDAHMRPSIANDQLGYFDTRVDYAGSGHDYDDSVNAAGQATNDAGIDISFAGILGSMSGDGQTMTIVDPSSQGESVVVETLIHEVQHDADQHKAGDPWADSSPGRFTTLLNRLAGDPAAADKAPSAFYNSYQSEFRAYWMENPEGSSQDRYGSSSGPAVTNITVTAVEQGADQRTGGGDDTTRSVQTSFGNERQEAIFKHLLNVRSDNVYWDWSRAGGAGGWTATYAYLPHYYALDPNFKRMVDAYQQPVAGNLINSVRIQALSTALTSGDLAQATAAVADLDRVDHAYLSDRTQSGPLWRQASSRLSPADFATYQTLFVAPMGPFLQETVTVQRGDTLGKIAERYLADPRRWRQLYNLNRPIIGGDPNRILAGQTLMLPVL